MRPSAARQRLASLATAAAALLLLLASAAVSHAGAPAAEVTLAAPLRHAVILRIADHARLLLAPGDVLGDPKEPGRSLKIEQVEPGVVVRLGGRRHTLAPGSRVPGLPGFRLVETVTVARIQYQYRPVEQVSQAEPVLAALQADTAVLEIQVPARPAVAAAAPPAPAAPAPPVPLTTEKRLDEGLLTRVRMREIAPEQYEVPKRDFRSVLENAAGVLSELQPFVLPSFSLASGVGYKITSAATDGQLSAQGFTVYDPKLAARAGIEIGDRILEVNGRAVDGLASLYRIYQELRANPVERIDVALERMGKLVTKSVRVR